MKAQALRRLLKEESLVYMPPAYDALGGRLIERNERLVHEQQLRFDC